MPAKIVLIEGESLATFHEFIQSPRQPVGPIENAFVETMALSQWRQSRLPGMQKAGINT